MKVIVQLLLLFTSTFAFAYKAEYPHTPEPGLTPGSLCQRPDQYRYPERIAYCERRVSKKHKEKIFQAYRQAGYRLNLKIRSNYKIDHFIPLCAGGSNNSNNLWPQHISVFTITDPLETLGCEKLREGRVSQEDLVQLIRSVKLNPNKATHALRFLQSL